MAEKSKRRLFIEELVENWQSAFDKKFPAGAKTRDERAVALYVRMARHDDVRSILEAAWPAGHDPDVEPRAATSWRRFHAEWWVSDQFADAVNDAINELRQFKRDRRAALRGTYRSVTRRGKRIKIRDRGPLPSLAVPIKPVVKKRS